MGRANRRQQGSRESSAATPAHLSRQRTGAWLRWYGPLLLAWVVLVYMPSLSNGFTYDDPSVVADAAPLLSDPSLVGRLFSADYFRLSGESTYRPIVTLTYMLDWQLGHGQPWVFHLQSVFWHVVAVGSLLLLLGRLGAGTFVRYAGAALYSVHPALTEAIDAVAFREDVLVTGFGLLGLLAMTGERPPRRGVRIGLSAFCFTLALLSKESAVVFLLLLPLTDWAIAESRGVGSWRPSRRAVEYVCMAACAAAYLVVRFVLFPASELYGNRIGGSLAASLATGAVALGAYLRLLVYPIELCADYRGVVAFVTSASDWRLWVSLGVITGLTFLAWKVRRRHPLALWGWAWFLLALGPVSNVVPIPAFMAERFLHLPYVGLIVFAVVVVNALAPRSHRDRRGLVGLTLAAIMLLSLTTWRRHQVWSSNEVLWQTTLRDHPTAQGALHGYGAVMIGQGRYADGLAYLQRVLDDPTIASERRSVVELEVGSAYDKLGQLGLARQHFERALAAAPDPRGRLGLAMTYYKLDRLDDARMQLEEAVRSLPDYAEAYTALGGVLSRQGRRAEAVEAWRQAVRLKPSIASAHANIGVTLGAQGQLDEGIAALERALALEPGQTPWHLSIARLLVERGRRDLAVRHLEEAIRVDPGFEPAREALQTLRAR